MDDTICPAGGCAGEMESAEWPEPDPLRMRVLIATNLAFLLYGGWVVLRRRPKWFPLWFAALAVWFTLCKYLICTRCERYGEPCDFYYLGRWAAMMFEPQPGRTLDTAGIAAEGGSVAVLQFLPVLASLGRPGMLLKFLFLLLTGQAAQLSICCRRCVEYSTDPWKREVCPSYRMAERMFFRERQ